MCPAVMKYNTKHGAGNQEIADKQAKVIAILWSEPEVAQTLLQAGLKKHSADLGDLLDCIVRALDLPRTLKEVNVSSDVIPALAERTLADFWAATNPIPLLKADQVREILEAVV